MNFKEIKKILRENDSNIDISRPTTINSEIYVKQTKTRIRNQLQTDIDEWKEIKEMYSQVDKNFLKDWIDNLISKIEIKDLKKEANDYNCSFK